MTETTIDRQTLAEQFYNAFERKERAEKNEYGDTAFYSLKDGSPEWMRDAIRAAHNAGEFLPNDWIYDMAHTVLGDLCDRDEWEDVISEIADSNVDVYNADRARWLASHLGFAAYIDDAVRDFGHHDQGVHGDIGMGQYKLIEEIAGALIAAIDEQIEQAE